MGLCGIIAGFWILPKNDNRNLTLHAQVQLLKCSGKRNSSQMKTDKLAKTYQVESGKHFRLKDFDPADTGHWRSKESAPEALQQGIVRSAELQDKLYAQDSWALLLIFQAMDAAGKDGIIKHVMSGINPQGCQVFSFKAPSDLELQHDFPGALHRRDGDSRAHRGRSDGIAFWRPLPGVQEERAGLPAVCAIVSCMIRRIQIG